VDFGINAATIRQGETFDGEKIDFTIQLQMCPGENIGTTGAPFNILTWQTSRGAVDHKAIERDTLCIFLPCNHVGCSPIVRDKKFYPRLSKDGKSLIVYIRGKFLFYLIYSTPLKFELILLSFTSFIEEMAIETLPQFAAKLSQQLSTRLEDAGETLNSTVLSDFEFLIRGLNSRSYSNKQAKNDVLSFRLIFPGSVQGSTTVFQSKHALSFQKRAISPEVLIVHGDVQTEFSRVQAFPVTKLGIGFVISVGASKTSNSLFMNDMEEEEEDFMLSRAFSGLLVGGAEARSASTLLSPLPTHRSPKSSRKSISGCKTPVEATAGETRGETRGGRKGDKLIADKGFPLPTLPTLPGTNNISAIDSSDDEGFEDSQEEFEEEEEQQEEV
jgi:hypothetical protein